LQSCRLNAVLRRAAKGGVEHLSFCPGSMQVVFGNTGRLQLWDIKTRTCVWKSQDRGQTPIVYTAFSPQNNFVAWLEQSHLCLLKNNTSGDEVARNRIQAGNWSEGSKLAWAADETRLLTSDSRGVVRIWDVAQAGPVMQLRRLDFDPLPKSHTTLQFLSFFDRHQSLVTDHGSFTIPENFRPPCANNILVPCPAKLLALRKDGWIWLVRAGNEDRFLCWLPPAYRPTSPSLNVNYATLKDMDGVRLITDSGRVVLLQINPEEMV
jgi:hypothetical protein